MGLGFLEKYLIPDDLLNDTITFLSSPLLLKGKITTIFAPAGVGKSTFVYKHTYFLLKCQLVNSVLCVFSDVDTTNSEFQALVNEYYNSEEKRFIPVMPNRNFWRDFKKTVETKVIKEELGIDFIIVDSLEQFFELVGLDFYKNVGLFFGVLRNLAVQGITVLLLHHTNKTGIEFSGRATVINQSDVVYRLRRAGRFKWYGDALKHRGAKELNGKIDFYAELTEDKIEFHSDILDDRYGYVVHLIKEVLRENRTCKQYEIVKKVKAKAEDSGSEVGVKKIREALAKYDGIFWVAKRREKNSLEYELIVDVKEAKEEDKEKDQEREQILSELESMISSRKIFADDMPPLLWNGKEYRLFIDIAKYVPTDELKKYLKRIKEEIEGEEDLLNVVDF